MKKDYLFLDAGRGRKWEQFGPYTLSRPYMQGYWPLTVEPSHADMTFSREGEEGAWSGSSASSWTVDYANLKMKIQPTAFGHVGLFPEHLQVCTQLEPFLKKEASVLNLFAYTGFASLFFAQRGAKVTHVDSSKGIVDWARENAKLNNIDSVRWIVEDVRKFLRKEVRREKQYDVILLDPPSFGRGSKGEIFKIETDLQLLLEDCFSLLPATKGVIALSCHTPGWTPSVLHNILTCGAPKGASGRVSSSGELILQAANRELSVPCGTYALWEK